MKQPPQFNFTISGFVIGVILIAMFSGILVMFSSALQTEFGLSGNITLDQYNKTQEILQYSKDLKNASTSIQQKDGLFDLVGAFFASGYSALKTAVTSFEIFDSMMNTAAHDVPEFGFFKNLFMAIIIIAIFMGVIIAAIVKWSV